jgi:hypothetical protein
MAAKGHAGSLQEFWTRFSPLGLGAPSSRRRMTPGLGPPCCLDRVAPSPRACSSLSRDELTAVTSHPHFAKYGTAKWPSPPTPTTATRSVERTPYCRMGVNTVAPAHISGPACSEVISSGSGKANCQLSTRTCVANPPWCPPTIVSRTFGQRCWSPPSHHSHAMHEPHIGPTPTRCPTRSRSTLAPTAATTPTASCPGTRGY